MYLTEERMRGSISRGFLTVVLVVFTIDVLLGVAMYYGAQLGYMTVDIAAACCHALMANLCLRHPHFVSRGFGVQYRKLSMTVSLLQDLFIVGLAIALISVGSYILAVVIILSWLNLYFNYIRAR